MKILAFDTSNNSTSVAISNGQDILAYAEDLNPSKQAERLIPMIEDALRIASLTYDEIDYLGVINGPGSFTGIRIGLAAAKGILLCSKIKGMAVTNFEMAHYRAKAQITQYDKIVIAINAYRNQLYIQTFDKAGGICTPSLIDYKEFLTQIPENEGKIIVAGSGVEFIYDQIKSLPNVLILPRFTRIKALHVCRYVDDIIGTQLLKAIEPLYIRPPDAIIKDPNDQKRI